MLKITGIVTALITPLTRDGSLCVECLQSMIRFQFERGIEGIFLMGTYGEGMIIPMSVRMKVLEKAMELAPSKVFLLPHIGSSDIEVATSLARKARDLGYEAVSSVGPIYHVPTKRGLVKYYERIAKEDVKIVIYNNKNRQNYNISPDDFETLVEEVPAIIGIKDTSYDVDQLLEYVVRFGNRYFIAGAGDNLIYYTFAINAHSHICGISNALPELPLTIYRAVRQGDHRRAIELQRMVNKIRGILRMYGVEPQEALREILMIRGINGGYPPIQMSEGLTEEQKEDLRRSIEPFLRDIEELQG